MPTPVDFDLTYLNNRLMLDELSYNIKEFMVEHSRLISCLNEEQQIVYDTIMSAVASERGGFFFVYGYGGTGKTFIWNTLSAAIRSKGDIVLNVASSGIAAQLLPGGRTAHSRFCIPLEINEDSTCNIKQGTPLAELLVKAKLIIWDEASVAHRFCFEALDKSLRDITRFSNKNSMDEPFGGKVVVLGGDFRHILPVIPKGSRQDIVHVTINSSYLWQFCKVLTLTQNMRLHTGSVGNATNEYQQFAEWILKVGDGKVEYQNDGEESIEIPDEFLIKDTSDPIKSIVDSTYPLLLTHMDDMKYFHERAILAPTLDMVDIINDFMLEMLLGEKRVYLSSDTICKIHSNSIGHEDFCTPEFLNTIQGSGLPNHVIKLKIGTLIILLRNIDKSSGLRNGTRLLITKLGSHVLEAKVISGNAVGNKVLIPRMLITPSDTRMPFKFQRRQFLISISFAMTINKSQSQSLNNVGLYLLRPVFSHGQLYVAISRVKKQEGLKILICDKDGNSCHSTSNVVYKEVLQNVN